MEWTSWDPAYCQAFKRKFTISKNLIQKLTKVSPCSSYNSSKLLQNSLLNDWGDGESKRPIENNCQQRAAFPKPNCATLN